MSDFDWGTARHALVGFGGEPLALRVYKTGLPFYDTLRLFGAIDLYIGTREDVTIRDCGDSWTVAARVRANHVKGRDLAAFAAVSKRTKPIAAEFCEITRAALVSGQRIPAEKDPIGDTPSELDPVLQSGIRGLAASAYDSMNSSSKSQCKATIPLSDALLAYAGRVRTESVGEITFLPIFEGQIDLGRIVSPLRAWLSVPNPLCAQALILLSLKTALWMEGYQDRLSAVVYSKRTQKTSFNYSGIIRIDSTAIGRISDGEFCSCLHRVFRRMLTESWKKKKATELARHTLAVAEWLVQPISRTIGAMISAQEFLVNSGERPFLVVRDNVEEVFAMTYPDRKIDHEAVRQLAKTTSSAIYKLGGKQGKDKIRQHWYNEVVALRNSPNKEAFRHRVLTIIEMGFAESSWVETFDPASLIESMGDGRQAFEEFRDCFRMYMIQASARKNNQLQVLGDDATEESGNEEEGTEGEES